VELRTMSLEVYQAEGPVVWTNRENVDFLKHRAAESPRGRARICAHPGPNDSLQEMLVALTRNNYIHPHFHPGKIESFHLIEGRMTVILFNEDGTILEVVPMGDFASGRPFYYRQTRPLFHTQIPESEFVVFQEVTQGPFTRDTVLASWAPPEGPDGKLKGYIEDLLARVQSTSRG
jgi:cupin fold WbuC family metalloprotein